MSGLARLLKSRGADVTGSDMSDSETLQILRNEGVQAEVATSGKAPDISDVLIISAAVRPDHSSVVDAVNRGLPVLTYAESLGRAMVESTGVAIAGTHGKSTTSAMLGWTLSECGLDPSVIVGATCRQLSKAGEATGFRLGSETVPIGPLAGRPGFLIAEACEFNRSFHNLHPTIASISAVEADHLDIYGSLDAVVEAFAGFASQVAPESEGGRLLIDHDKAHRREVTRSARCAVETIGFSPAADWRVQFDAVTRRVVLSHEGRDAATWTMRIPGEHNAMNSALAGALALNMGADATKVGAALSEFAGVDRRVQMLGEREGVRVYDDYGHHPTEIDATLRALREHERPHDRGGRLICVFQPHQHSRTRFLLEEFAQSFSQADVVIVPHIYFVRDSEIEKTKVSAADLVDRLRRRGVQAMHLYPFEAIIEQLEVVCRPNDLLVVMGAGPVWQVARGYLSAAPA